MLVLVCYDVNVSSEGGANRLRHVAKICQDYGQRVQFSVFECNVSPGQYVTLKQKLNKVIDSSADGIRFYHLGKNWQRRLEHIGINNAYDPEKDSFIF